MILILCFGANSWNGDKENSILFSWEMMNFVSVYLQGRNHTQNENNVYNYQISLDIPTCILLHSVVELFQFNSSKAILDCLIV